MFTPSNFRVFFISAGFEVPGYAGEYSFLIGFLIEYTYAHKFRRENAKPESFGFFSKEHFLKKRLDAIAAEIRLIRTSGLSGPLLKYALCPVRITAASASLKTSFWSSDISVSDISGHSSCKFASPFQVRGVPGGAMPSYSCPWPEDCPCDPFPFQAVHLCPDVVDANAHSLVVEGKLVDGCNLKFPECVLRGFLFFQACTILSGFPDLYLFKFLSFFLLCMSGLQPLQLQGRVSLPLPKGSGRSPPGYSG